MRIVAALLLVVTPVIVCAGPFDDFDLVQKMRTSTDALPETPAGQREAREILLKALAHLDSADVRERAEGHPLLYFRRFDVNYDLAVVNAKLGDRGAAISSLEAAARIMWLPFVADKVEKDPVFAPYLDDPRLRTVLANLRASDRVLPVPAMATPYKETLSVEERIAGLTLFWSEARAGFTHFDNVPNVKWDEVFMRFLPQVMAAQTTREYYTVLMKLAAILRDGHTNVYPPKELERFFEAPPMRTEWIEGKVLVTDVRSDRLRRQVSPGEELVAIDGLDVHRYAAEKVSPFVSASTQQDLRFRSYTYHLLDGDATKPVRLRLRDAGGRDREEAVARDGYDDIRGRKRFTFRLLDGGVAYLSLDHFESDAGVKALEAALPQILEARALVLDLRRNGGGNTLHGSAILSYLTGKPVPHAMSFRRFDSSHERANFDFVSWTPIVDRPYVQKRDRVFMGPVAVLAGPQTFSAAEDFLISFSTLKRGIIVGETTAGSSGQPLVFAMPGGGSGRICVKRDLWPDGARFVGVGIKPDVEVSSTVASVRNGTDPVLEAAIARLR